MNVIFCNKKKKARFNVPGIQCNMNQYSKIVIVVENQRGEAFRSITGNPF
jgi:hypothetical protein